MSAGRILAIVFGTLAILIGLGVAAGGGAVLVLNAVRDDDGYLTSPTETLRSDGYAVVSEDVEVESLDWPGGGDVDIRVTATSRAGGPVFIGIARTADVTRYLARVPHDVVRDIEFSGAGAPDLDTQYTPRPGTRAPAPPITEDFWEASVAGTGEQVLDWELREGRWTFVLMRPGGERGVEADTTVGVRIPSLLWLGIVLLVVGLLLVVGGALLIFLGARRRGDAGPPSEATTAVVTGAPAGGAGPRAPPYPGPPGAAATAAPAQDAPDAPAWPMLFEGELDPGLSRWQWLVKWLLAIPHYVVLFFLGIAFAVLTVVAFFAIVFTGRYPRGIFEFNVGVMRWSWRVSFYALTAIGTDRYPPFSLADDPSYPARFDVPYPERLSRGLVWVKWWLLAIPHYIVIGFFVGSWSTAYGESGWWSAGLIGVLTLFAGVALLFTGRYPGGIFRLLVGLNRWVYRVYAYASLMRDEYPPFRLGR